ncbi:MAG: hypothetical protein IJ062_04145 [Firmicutes bacterium]|nr:hypothetical protein [Bacillota bacterium]
MKNISNSSSNSNSIQNLVSNFTPCIGIDRSVLTGFSLIYVDQSISRYKNVECQFVQSGGYSLNNGVQLTHLSISDDRFGKLSFAMNKGKWYGRLEMSSSNYINLQPLNTEQYIKRIDEVFNYIEFKYNVKVFYTLNSLIINQIEINATFYINSNFRNYRRAVKCLMSNVPPSDSRGNKVFYVSENKISSFNFETAFVSGTSRKLIIYDKCKNILDKHDVNIGVDIMRIEYLFKNRNSGIASRLGKSVADLTDYKIKYLFCNNFMRDFINPIKLFRHDIENYLLSKLNSYHSYSGMNKQWVSFLMDDIKNDEEIKDRPVIISIQDIIKAVMKCGLFVRPKITIKTLLNAANTRYSYLLDNNPDKVEEIISTVMRM